MMKSHLLIRKMHYNPGIKLWLLFIFSLLTFAGTAQTAAYYGFSQSSGTYTALTNPTNIATATAASGSGGIDEQVYPLDNVIPFNFTFNGQNYTSVKVHANGFLSFGGSTTASSDPLSASAYDGVISPFAADLQALYNINSNTGAMDYEILGTAPQREFVVEWRHFRAYSSTAATAANHHDWNFQVRLKEDGTIRFVYNCTYAGTPSSANAKVGLKGATSADYNNRYATGTATSNWGNTVPGTFSSQGIATNYNFLPAQGLTFTWTPPAGCQAPTAQPTALVLTNTGIIINAAFTTASPAADRYLVLRNIAGTTPNAPANGTTYATGQNTALNSYVAYYGTSTSFENNYNHGIRGNNQYVYTIYAVSTNCTGGPLYNTTAPLTGSITNCPATVNGITANGITSGGFTLAWPATENGTANTFSTILEVATNSTFTNMVQGSPFTLSSTTLLQAISGLQPNTQYFYRAKNASTQCESSYSSVASLYTGCVPVTAFYEGFDGVTGTALPNCWSKILTGSAGTPTINVTTTDNFSAPNNVSFYGNGADTDAASTKIILVSPELTNIAAGTHRLRFRARKTTASNSISLRVVALDGNTANANITVIQTITDLTTTYQEFTVYLTGVTGNASHIGIQRVGGSSYSYMYVDDVTWEAVPSCPELQSVASAAVGPATATVSWVNVGNTVPQGGYEYFVSTTNTPPAETQTFVQTTQTSVNLSQLSSGTTYYVFVRRICSITEKSIWKSVSFSTLVTAPAPWVEEFLTSTPPTGWSTTGWSFGTTRGVTGNGNSPVSLYKNLYGTATTGTFNTIAVGPLNAPNYELSFYYKVSNYDSPYATPAEWGNFNVQVSTDFGTTWTTLETITNQATTGVYTQKMYSLSAYQGQYVQVKITANRTAGDYDLSFDNFRIQAPAIAVQSVDVSVANNAPATITQTGGTLQLQAVVNPLAASQAVTWSVVSGTGFATVNANGLVTAVANGTATVRATAVADASKFEDLDIVVNTEPIVTCAPLTYLYENFDTLSCCNMGVVPVCWDSILLGGASQIISSTQPASGTSQIYQNGYGAGKISIVVLPQLSNINAGTHQFRFKVKANGGPGALDFGYVTNVSDASSFILLEALTISNSSYNSADAERIFTVPANVPANARLAVRNPGTTWAGMYWDDVYWEPIAITSVLVSTQNNADAEITEENGTLQLQAVVNPLAASQAVTWSVVSGTAFATVSQTGLVTALANGTVTVRATSVADITKFDDIEITISYEVIVPVESVTVSVENNADAEITEENGTLQLLAVVNPTAASQAVTWSVLSGNAFATVSQTGLVTALANGTVTVRATSVADVTKFDDIEVTISYEVIIPVESVTVSVENNAEPAITILNGTLQLVAVVNPNAADQSVTWSVVSGDAFATVNQTGLVTALAYGTVTVRATSVADATKFDDIEVTISYEVIIPVESVTVSVENNAEPAITILNGTLQLVAVVNPNAADQSVTWSVVSGDAFATVSQTGLVTALADGTFTVRATSVADATKFDDIEIVIAQIAGIENPDGVVFSIYPNPAQDVVTISSALETKQISIYNQVGQLVLTVNNAATVNLSGIAAGVYIIEARFENGAIANQKLIKR